MPPAALAIHLCIGQAYAFSVFKLPLTKVLGITDSAPDDWKQTELAWIFTIAIVFLGLSAAVFGRWLEHAGPRKSGFVAAHAAGALGFFVSALGVQLHNIWLLYLGLRRARRMRAGAGLHHPGVHLDQVVSGPARDGDRAWPSWGSAAGAMIASPLSQLLLDHYKSATSVGVAETFVTLGTIYFVAMLSGAFALPGAGSGVAAGGAGSDPSRPSTGCITLRHVHRGSGDQDAARSGSSGRCCS